MALLILPTIIAAARSTENLGWIIPLDLPPTGIGWPAVFILATMPPRRQPTKPHQPRHARHLSGHTAQVKHPALVFIEMYIYRKYALLTKWAGLVPTECRLRNSPRTGLP